VSVDDDGRGDRSRLALVVHDEPIVSTAIRHLLETHEFEVLQANSLEASLASLGPRIDVAIIEWCVADGIAAKVVDEIVGRGLPCGLILTSRGVTTEPMRALARARGVRFLPRPFDNRTLVHACTIATELAVSRRASISVEGLLPIDAVDAKHPGLDLGEAFLWAAIEVLNENRELSPSMQSAIHLRFSGWPLEAAARHLGISPHTYRNHLQGVRKAVGAESMAELLRVIAQRLSAKGERKPGNRPA
jgi:DNA-binding NarL/FixJ family response regulator